MTTPQVVTLAYSDLVRHHEQQQQGQQQVPTDLLEKIGQAFGSESSLGIIAVVDVPNFAQLRMSLLPLAQKLATLPPNELDAVTVPQAGYQVGWSHGKERVEGDKFDTSKGSFYANPLADDLLRAVLERRRDGGHRGRSPHDGSTNRAPPTEAELRSIAEENPTFFAPNVWPTESIPELEGRLKEVGGLICRVGRLVASLCDSYVSTKCPGYAKGKLEAVLTESLCCKARLLHYFPAPDVDRSELSGDVSDGGDGEKDGEDTDFSDWCGWHNDHGSLTGLVPAIYLDKDGNEVACPDASAGLYIKSRRGELVHVQLPQDALAFQIGETAQIHTGGVLQATPHAVRGCSRDKGSNTSRETFAVFMEPEYHGDMCIPKGSTVEDTQRREVEKHLPKTVRTLRSRWEDGMNFGAFSNATFAAFH